MIIIPSHPSAETTHATVTMDNGTNIYAAAEKAEPTVAELLWS